MSKIKISTTISAVADALATISISRQRDINDVLPSNLVDQQFPSFIREDYPKMVEFTRAYYDYMAQTENGRIRTLRNIDETSGKYLDYIQNEFLYNAAKPNFQQDFAAEDFIRFSRQFYSAKGTEESIKFLFRAQTGQEVDIEYPSELIFKASTAKWFQEQSVKIVMNVDSIPATYFIGNYLTFKNSQGKEQTVEVSNVIDITETTAQTDVSTVFEVFFTTELIIDVAPGDTLFGTNFHSTIIPSLTEVQITNPGTNFRVGQIIKLDGATGSGAIAVITSVLSGGVIRNIKLIKFGTNYTTNFSVSISPDSISLQSGTIQTADNITDTTEGFIESQSILRSDYVLNDSSGSTPNYTNPGYIGSYVSQSTNRQVLVLEENYSGLLFCKIGAVCTYSGKYLDQTGIPSNSNVLQDNDYYQDFSYVINSPIDIENYRDSITALAHPAGFKMFGGLSIENEFESDTTLSESAVTSDLNVTNFDFLSSETLDKRITFTRTGTATRYNSSGLIETVAANTPRFDYNPATLDKKGLLIEETKTNLFLHSEYFDKTTWSKAGLTSITRDVITSPTGNTQAEKFIEGTGTPTSPFFYLYQAVTGLSVTTVYTVSLFVKAAERSYIQLRLDDNGSLNTSSQQFNLNNGTLQSTSSISGTVTSAIPTITSVGNGWYRVSLTATFSAAPTALSVKIQMMNNAPAVAYTGDGVSGLYVWGAQLEATAFPTSYIPSTNTFTTRASVGTYIDSTGTLQTAANNVARYQYNPENLSAQPYLLLEESRINSIRNNTMVGAVTGVPGTIPTNWQTTSLSGISYDVSGTGIENGINYVDIRVSGTSSVASYANITPDILIAAVSGQTWTASFWAKLVSGSLTNTNANIEIRESDATQNFLANILVVVPLTSTLTRYKQTKTLNNASTAFASLRFIAQISIGLPVDFTVRIGLPQLEQGTFVSSVIKTSTAAVTRQADGSTAAQAIRNADNAKITGSNFSSWFNPTEGTIFTEILNKYDTVGQRFLSFNDDTTGNLIEIISSGGGLGPYGYIASSSVGQTAAATGSIAVNTSYRVAFAYKTNDAQVYRNGSSVTTDSSVTLPTVTQLFIGSALSNSLVSNSCIKQIKYYPSRLSNTELQLLSTYAFLANVSATAKIKGSLSVSVPV